MYHEDKGLIVDVELLAECGQIAQHLRKLERHWKINLKDLQKQSIRGFTKPPIPSTDSVKENLDRIFDIASNQSVQLVNKSDNVHYIDEDDDDDLDEDYSKHVRYLEDVVIKIYQLKQRQRIDSCFDDNRQPQQREEIACKNSIESSSSSGNNNTSKVHIKSNMNYSVAGAVAVEATKNNNNELTASPLPTTDTRDDQHFEAHLCTQKQHQTETTTALMKIAATNTAANIESSGSDNNNQSLMNNDSDKQEQDLNPATNICDVGYIAKQQQQLCAKISDEDFKILLREMKRKVEFTEKMNWLCLSNRPNPPPQRKSSLPKHSDVKKAFVDMCYSTFTEDVLSALRLPTFDSYQFEDYEILKLMEIMFVELNFIEKFRISLVRLREWLYEVYKYYNDVPFHNFRHCFCVTQMMYAITWQTNLISRIGDMDVFILLISCICHDLDHPGYNNIYQINAKTELALRYNDISPLENHHCSIAFRLLELPECNLLENITKDMYKEIREGIIRCILATDMARHNDILTQFREIISIFDYKNNSHKNLLCMVLIKVADISNEARPLEVAEPWLDRLLQEFFAQSAAEKTEGLPVTPFMDPDKVTKPGSQVRFIGLVLLPLFEALGDLLPELVEFIISPVKFALDFYRRLNEAAQKNRKSLVDCENSSSDGGVVGAGGDEIIPRSQSGISVRSRRSIPSQKSASKNSVDEEQMLIAAELHDLPEGSESGDSETATEVDVAEKTSKFKVDTESRNKLNMQMMSRKTNHHHHRDKRPSMVSEMGNRARGSYGNLQHNYSSRINTFGSNRAISLDHYNHRRMSDGIQTVTSDSTVYYHPRANEQEMLLRTGVIESGQQSHSCQGSADIRPCHHITDTKHINEEQSCCKSPPSQTELPATDENEEPNRVQFTKSNFLSRSFRSKLNSSVNCSPNSPKSIITRLRQLTGRLSFSFDKDSRRLSGSGGSASVGANVVGGQAVIKTSPVTINSSSKNNNVMPNICCNAKSAIDGQCCRNRALSLDVPTTKYHFNSSGASSNDGSRKSLSSNKHDDVDDDTESNSIFTSKKMSAEVEVPDI